MKYDSRSARSILPVLSLIVLLFAFISLHKCTDFYGGLSSLWELVREVVSGFWGGLEWPHAVVIIFILAVALFRSRLEELLSRLKSVRKDGFEFTEALPMQDSSEPSAAEKVLPNPEYPDEFRRGMKQVEEFLATCEGANAFELLKVSLANFQVHLFFENTYSNIFGGQIEFLIRLNQLSGGMDRASAEGLWKLHQQEKAPDMNSWNMDEYLGFLFQRELIVVEENMLRISVRGKEFLVWMTKGGRPHNRPW